MTPSQFNKLAAETDKRLQYINEYQKTLKALTQRVEQADEVEWKAHVGLLADGYYQKDYYEKLDEYAGDLLKNADLPVTEAHKELLSVSLHDGADMLVRLAIPVEYFYQPDEEKFYQYNRFPSRF